MQPLNRSEAKRLGIKTYIGSDCKNGHASPIRRTDNGSCVECIKDNKHASKARQERFKLNNPERLREIKRKSELKQKSENPERRREYHKLRMRRINKTSEGKLRQFIKGSLRKCLKSKNGKSSYSVVGYGYEELKKHLESLFKDGMSWDNYGQRGWHVDHIKPISAFLREGVSDPRIINALSNLQPMWGTENQSKGGRYDG